MSKPEVEVEDSGAVVAYWNQEQPVYPCRELDLPAPNPPKRLLNRIFRHKPYRIDVRIKPPQQISLDQYGKLLAERVGVPISGSKDPSDQAIWLVASGRYGNVNAALQATNTLLHDKLAGVHYTELQVRVAGLDDQPPVKPLT